MIYQFEHKKISRCHECPMWDIKGGNEISIEWCNLQDAQMGYDCTPKENDCPLVAVSKTETTTEPCDICSDGYRYNTTAEEDAKIKARIKHGKRFCSYCGRKLKGE